MTWLAHYITVSTSENSFLEKKLKEMEHKLDALKVNVDYETYKRCIRETEHSFKHKKANVDQFINKLVRTDTANLEKMEEIENFRNALSIGSDNIATLNNYILDA
jgi:hypothetical protein